MKNPPSLWRIFLFPFVGSGIEEGEAWKAVRAGGQGRFLLIKTLAFAVPGTLFVALLETIFPAFPSRTWIDRFASLALIGFIYAIAQWYFYERKYKGSA